MRTDWLTVGAGGCTGGLGNQNNLADNQVKCSSHVNSLFSPSSSTLQWEQICNYSGKIEFLNRFLRTHLINPQQSCRDWGHWGSWFGDQLSLLMSTCLFKILRKTNSNKQLSKWKIKSINFTLVVIYRRILSFSDRFPWWRMRKLFYFLRDGN